MRTSNVLPPSKLPLSSSLNCILPPFLLVKHTHPSHLVQHTYWTHLIKQEAVVSVGKEIAVHRGADTKVGRLAVCHGPWPKSDLCMCGQGEGGGKTHDRYDT